MLKDLSREEASEPFSEKPNLPQSAVRAAEAAAMVDYRR